MKTPERARKKRRLYDPAISTSTALAQRQINEGTAPDEDAATCKIWNTELKRRGWNHRAASSLGTWDFFRVA